MMLSVLLIAPALAQSGPADPGSSYGAEASVSYMVGTLIGPWPEPGLHGTLLARYDAFIAGSESAGPRLGASLWGSTAAWPLQHAVESEEATEDFGYTHAGVMALVRYDPQAPVAGTFGFGFSRLDLVNYWGGPLALPMLSFEAGIRRPLAANAIVDLQARAHWSTARSGIDSTALEEWWLVQLGLSLGWRLH